MSAPGEDVPQDSTMDTSSEGAASQPLIMPTSTLSGIASGRSRTLFTTAMESHSVSFYQADGPIIADLSTTVSDWIQSLEPPSSSTESPPAIEPNPTSPKSSSSPTSEFSLNDILDDNTTFTPQAPVATAIDSTTTHPGAGTPDEQVPHMDSDAATESTTRIDEGPLGDVYLAPGDAYSVVRRERFEDPIRGTYRIGDPVTLRSANHDSQRRLNVALPNPRNLPTFEMVMTVPYELGRDPVRLEVTMPPGNSRFVSERTQVFQFTVTQEADYREAVPAPGP